MKHHATTLTMPEIKPTLIEKLTIIRHRQGFRSSDEFAEKIGLTGPTLRAYENGTRSPSKFTKLYIDNLIAIYEREGLKAMIAAAQKAKG